MNKFEREEVQKVMVKVYVHHLSEKLNKDPKLARESVNIAKTDKKFLKNHLHKYFKKNPIFFLIKLLRIK
jgi:hypothetical protein